jgi:cytochrome c1
MMLLVVMLLAALPIPGTQFKQLPNGKGKTEVEAGCYACHSADLLAQQRLTPKQWTATVEKMMRWGAAVKEPDKQIVIDYLSKHFGPENRFTPTVTETVK